MLRIAGLVFLCMLAPALAGASEFADRNFIQADMQVAVQTENFAHIEKRYAEATKANERFPSGQFKSDATLYAIERAIRLARETYERGMTPQAQKEDPEAPFTAMDEKTARWQKAYPSSSLAAFARSEAYISHAFFHRGTRYAREVDPAKWKEYGYYIEQAYEALAVSQLPRDLPWYSGILQLAPFASTDLGAFKRLVEEASSHYPSNVAIYSFASTRFEPKWGGSIDAFDWLANLAASRNKNVDGMALYAAMYQHFAYSSDFKNNLFTATRADWKKMKQGYEDMVKAYPVDQHLNQYAWFACLAKDAVTLKRVLTQIGTNIDQTVWNAETLTRCRRLANDGK